MTLTWKELKEKIEAMPEDEQAQDATVYIGDMIDEDELVNHRLVKDLSFDGVWFAIKLD